MRRYELEDEHWDLIGDLFERASRGRPWRDHRMVVNGIFWILFSGAPWRDLPERYGAWQTAHRRFTLWRRDGTWDKALARLKVQHVPSPKVVVLSLEESPDLDGSSLESLAEFSVWLDKRHIELRLARLKDRARDALLHAEFPRLTATALEYPSVDDAVRGDPTGGGP